MVIERELKKLNGMFVILCGVIVALVLAIMSVAKCRVQIDAKYDTRRQVELKLEAALLEADNDWLVLNNDRNLRDQAAVWADEETGWWSDSPSVAARTAVRLTHDYGKPVGELHSREDLEEALKSKMKFAPSRWLAEYLWFGLCKNSLQYATIDDAVKVARYANWAICMAIVFLFLSMAVKDREEMLQSVLAKMPLERQARYERYVWKPSTVLYVIEALGVCGLLFVALAGASGLAWFALGVGVLAIVIVAIPDQTIDALREKARRRYEREERKQNGQKAQQNKKAAPENGTKSAPKNGTKSQQTAPKDGSKAQKGEARKDASTTSGQKPNATNDQKPKMQRRIVDGKMVLVRVDNEPETGAKASGQKASSTMGPQKSNSKKKRKKRKSLPARYYAKFERAGSETRPSLFRNVFYIALLIIAISLLIQALIILGPWKLIVTAIVIAALYFGAKAYGAYRRKVFEEWLENQEDEEEDDEEEDEDEYEDEDEDEDDEEYDDGVAIRDVGLAGEILTSIGKAMIAKAQNNESRRR